MTTFRGIYSIPVTPFDESGDVDLGALRSVVDWCISEGAHGLVTPVFVSEFFTLTEEEAHLVLTTTINAADGRVPVIAGVSAPSTRAVREAGARARDAGASAAIALPPYVRKATLAGVIEYFEVLSAAFDGPVFVQNAEGPIGTPMSASQMLELTRRIHHVSWVKEETLRSSHVITALLATSGDGLTGVMGGKGSRFLLDEYRRGVAGTMPGCEFTRLNVELWGALERSDLERAHDLHSVLLPLASMEDQYGGPAFCKEVLRKRGVISSTVVREPGSPRIDAPAAQLLDELLDRADAMMGQK